MFRKKTEKRRGVVLVSVLAIIVLLLAILMEFAYRSKIQLDIAHHRMTALKTQNALESAVEITKALLAFSTDMDAPEVRQFFEESRVITYDDIEISVFLEPESRKINLNNMVGSGGDIRRREYRLLFALADVIEQQYNERILDSDMIMAILEWITPETEPGLLAGSIGGEPAGDEYYRALTPPYECKHAPLNCISELLLVRGFDEGILYGKELAENVVFPGLAKYFTLYGNSHMIRDMLLRAGEITLEDIDEVGPDTHENFITIIVVAEHGNIRREERVIFQRNQRREVFRERR